MSTFIQFGAYVKSLRLSRGYGLRRFAEMIGEMPSNLSSIEHGKRKAWQSTEKLRTVADKLALQEGSREWDQLFRLANRPSKISPDIENVVGMEMFPALCRTINELRLTDNDLRNLVDHLRKEQATEDDNQ